MKLLFLVSCAFFVLPSLANTLEIKGLQVDKPVDCQKINDIGREIGPYEKALSCEAGRRFWSISAPFLDGYAVITLGQSLQRILTSVSVGRINFDDALKALTIKFGPPTVKNSVIQNRMGASFDQVEATWRDGELLLTLLKHSSTIDNPVLRLTGAEYLKDAARRSEEKAQKGASNL